MEVLAFKLLDVLGGLEEIVNKPELDELRNYVRRGSPNNIWPYSKRPLYVPHHLFNDGNEIYELLHEYDILVTDNSEFYIVVILFGDEYALNLGGREIGGYERWLEANDGKSPLCMEKMNSEC